MTKNLSKCKPRHIPINLELVPEINLCIDKPKVHIRHSRCKTKCHRRSKHKRKSKCKCKNYHKCKCEDEDSSHYSSSDFSDSRAIF
jgi:hypothetical protein